MINWGRTSVNSIEEISSLLMFLDVSINEERVRLRMDILHHDLESIEAAGFGNLDFAAESLDQVLVHDTIGSSEEGKDVRDEITLIVVKSVVPIMKIF